MTPHNNWSRLLFAKPKVRDAFLTRKHNFGAEAEHDVADADHPANQRIDMALNAHGTECRDVPS